MAELTIWGVSFKKTTLTVSTQKTVDDFCADNGERLIDSDDVFECPFLNDAAIVFLYKIGLRPFLPAHYLADSSGVHDVYESINYIANRGSESFVWSDRSVLLYAALLPTALSYDTADKVEEPSSIRELQASGLKVDRFIRVVPFAEGYKVEAYFVAEEHRVRKLSLTLEYQQNGKISNGNIEETSYRCFPVDALL